MSELATFADQVADAVERCYGAHKACARKSGRFPHLPYVAVIRHSERGRSQTKTCPGWAFATADEAKAHAEKAIETLRERMAADLREPCQMAYRRQWGLPQWVPA